MSWISSLINKSLVSKVVAQVTKWLKERAIHIPEKDLSRIDTVAQQIEVKAKKEFDQRTDEALALLHKTVSEAVKTALDGKVSAKLQAAIVDTICATAGEQLVTPLIASVEDQLHTYLLTMASNSKQFIRETESKIATQIANEFAENVGKIIKL